MAVREDLVSSAVQFLQDPSVSSSSVENRMSFLRSKNLTQEEIDAALARASGQPAPSPGPPYPSQSGAPPSYYQQYPQYAWQPPPPPPRRDWRDWFIMATVVGGMSYGLYSLGKRYVYPLIAPPTPERLEEDKKSIEEQFDKAFSLVEQLAKDTEELKTAEKDRSERLDTALAELESVMSDLKAANRRREDDAARISDEVKALKDAIPKAMDNQKEATNNRLRELNTELGSLKTLVSHRMTSSGTTPTPSSAANGHLRAGATTGATDGGSTSPGAATSGSNVPVAAAVTDEEESKPEAAPTPNPNGISKSGIISSRGNGGKASIPAWQLAMRNTSSSAAADGESTGEAQPTGN